METKFNKSQIFNRAWYLVKKKGSTLSEGLIQAWKEARTFVYERREDDRLRKARTVSSPQPDVEYMHTYYSTNRYKGD